MKNKSKYLIGHSDEVKRLLVLTLPKMGRYLKIFSKIRTTNKYFYV